MTSEAKERARQALFEQSYFEGEARGELIRMRCDFISKVASKFEMFDRDWVTTEDGGLDLVIHFSMDGIREFLGKPRPN